MKTRIENTAANQSISGRINSFVIAAGILIAVICSFVVFNDANAAELADTKPFEVGQSLEVKFPSVVFQLPISCLNLDF